MVLTGKTTLITRAATQSAELRKQLELAGARVLECPTIQIVPPKTWKPVDEVIGQLDTYQWLLFTSANAVAQFMSRMRGKTCHVPIAVVGAATAAKLGEWDLKPSLLPREYRAEGLLDVFPNNMVGQRVLFPRAEIARELLPEELRRRGAVVDVVTVYRTTKAEKGSIRDILQTESVDCIVFTSPSTIADDLAGVLPKNVAIAVIGPATREAAKLLGLEVHIMPVQSTIPDLVSAIKNYFVNDGTT
jgi:uroporphyrinogen III methyltransferase / synthase